MDLLDLREQPEGLETLDLPVQVEQLEMVVRQAHPELQVQQEQMVQLDQPEQRVSQEIVGLLDLREQPEV